MVCDILLQMSLILLLVFIFLYLHGITKKLLTKFRYINQPSTQAKHHFIKCTQLLNRARSSKNRTSLNPPVEEALPEADRAIKLYPKEAASYLLRAMTLDFQGFRTSALESIYMALPPLAAKFVDDVERGDALLKRARLKIAVSQVDSTLDGLTRSVKLSPKNVKAWYLLGECYKGKKMEDEAKKAYEFSGGGTGVARGSRITQRVGFNLSNKIGDLKYL